MMRRCWLPFMTLCLIGAMVAAQGEKRVTIEVKEAPVAEAFDQLFRAVGENFVLMPGTPTEQRLTLRLVDVPFERALSFLCEVAGLKWERKDGTYLISPAPRPPVPPTIPAMPPFAGIGAMGGMMLPGAPVLSGEAMEKLLEKLLVVFPSEVRVGEIRCPKCRNFIRLQCPQCKRPVSQNWRFCPYDGTKLPPAPEKCPKCGAPLPKAKWQRPAIGE